MVRKNLGRRKIEIEKIKNQSNLQEIAIIVFSPGEKVYSFGNPNINVLLVHFSGRILRDNNTNLVESNRKLYIQMLNDSLTEAMAENEKEQKNKHSLVQNERENKNAEKWWEKSPKELNLTQLTCLKHVLEDLKMKVDEITSYVFQTNPNYHVGSSSNFIRK
ncbi:hypothetical protein ARALYDRAFT_894296 [Arabidopsis lyrata subsp. lyrata]|uniref:MADS-box domain-containing protein n=1 Tax=Arabidopsis lyrata subsp. lyrata TaxID=81972 RepID=D7KTQ6_ARALL|nr:hypothetical protein ARALYDRAFT_894296 [Arabidopsis lyrata subsp. lyrata]